MDKKLKAAVNMIDEVCAKFLGTRQDHIVLTSALQLIVAALDSKKEPEKIDVPKKALPRD